MTALLGAGPNMPTALKQLLKGDLSEKQVQNEKHIKNSTPEALREWYALIADVPQKCPFSPGDLIQWRPKCRDHRWPFYGVPAVVLQVLDEPIVAWEHKSCENLSSTSATELMDMVIGVMDEDNDVIRVFADSRRYQIFDEETYARQDEKYLASLVSGS